MTSKYTKAAKGQMCQVRIPGVCNHDPETTVFAHLNGSGMGTKHRDIHGSFCCSDCHDVYDGRVPYQMPDVDSLPEVAKVGFSRVYLNTCFLEGMVRTQNLLIEMGILIL